MGKRGIINGLMILRRRNEVRVDSMELDKFSYNISVPYGFQMIHLQLRKSVDPWGTFSQPFDKWVICNQHPPLNLEICAISGQTQTIVLAMH